MQCIGLDVGFGFTKAFSDGKAIKFPSWLSLVPSSIDSEVEPFIYVSRYFWVGEDARFSAKRIEINEPEDIIYYYPLFRQKVLREFNLDNALIITGLPPSAFFDKNIDKGNIQDKLLFQGMGILVDARHSNLITHDDHSVIIIDIGFNTVDYLVVVKDENDKRWKRVNLNSIYNLGVSEAVSMFRDKLPSDLSILKNWSKQKLIEIFEKKYVVIEGERIDLSSHIDFIMPDYTAILLARLKSEVGAEIAEVDKVVIAGGGAHLIDKTLQRNIVIPDDPEFSNARGYYYYGMKEDKDES